MSKTLCKLVKQDLHTEKPKKYLKKVLKPKYMCENCGRVANDKKFLCSPVKIKKM